jgi:hypothetical protein
LTTKAVLSKTTTATENGTSSARLNQGVCAASTTLNAIAGNASFSCAAIEDKVEPLSDALDALLSHTNARQQEQWQDQGTIAAQEATAWQGGNMTPRSQTGNSTPRVLSTTPLALQGHQVGSV